MAVSVKTTFVYDKTHTAIYRLYFFVTGDSFGAKKLLDPGY